MGTQWLTDITLCCLSGVDEADAHADIADWPDAFRVNLWVQHLSDRDGSADEALGDFKVLLPDVFVECC